MPESDERFVKENKRITDEIEKMNIAVAEVTLAWSSIESALIRLLRTVIAHEGLGAASAIYFSPTNLETRITIVDHAFRELIEGHKRERMIATQWDNILLRINRLKNTRNKVAHGEVITHVARRKSHVRLTAQLLDFRRRREERAGKQLPGMSCHDLLESAVKCDALAELIGRFETIVSAMRRNDELPLLRILRGLRVALLT